MTSTNRGGKRPGAGRPVAGDEATEARTVTLLPRHWAGLDGDNVSLSLRETLDRLTIAIADTRGIFADYFNDAERGAILDAVNGWHVTSADLQFIAAEVDDALPGGLAEKWGIDGPFLVRKLRIMKYFECWALTDACQRWWKRVGAGEQLQPSQLFD